MLWIQRALNPDRGRWSFLDNPRMPAEYNRSRAATEVTVPWSRGEAAAEVKRLQGFGTSQVDVLGSWLLSSSLRSRLVERMGNAYGSWCCRPRKDPTSMPNNYGFRLLDAESVNKYTQLSSVEAPEGRGSSAPAKGFVASLG